MRTLRRTNDIDTVVESLRPLAVFDGVGLTENAVRQRASVLRGHGVELPRFERRGYQPDTNELNAL